MAKKKKAEKEMGSMASPSMEPKDGSEKDWEANNAYDNLCRGCEHKKDPDLMERVRKVAGRKKKAIEGLHADLGFDADDGLNEKPKSIEDLKKIRNRKVKESRYA